MTNFREPVLPERFNAAERFLTKNVEVGRGAKTAYVHAGGELSFAEVLDQARRAAALLRASGADEEQRVALFLDDSPELVIALWGALWAGCVAVPINRAASDEDVRYILRDSRARVLVTDTAGATRIGAYELPHLRTELRTDAASRLLDLVSRTAPMPRPAETHRDEAAFWLYTSGSTGRPKGVVHAHGDMVPCAEHYGREVLGLDEEDTSLSVAKIPFAYGLGATFYMPMWVGARAILAGAGNAFDVAETIRELKPTILWGIPSMYSELLSASSVSDVDLSSIRLCVSAAESLPVSVFHAFHDRFGLEVCEGIGTTELLHVFLSNRPGHCTPGSCGRPVPGYDVRVVDELGNTVKPGEVGDLEVRGPSLMLGYWNRRAETLRPLRAGAMRTGDKYRVDEEGNFRFMGRSDDLFKVNGQWVVPSEVEAALREDRRVRDCAVVLDRGEGHALPTLVGYVALADGVHAAPGIAEAIRREAKQRLAHFKVPRRIRLVGELPRSVTGKVDRKVLSRALVEDATRAAEEGHAT